MTEVFGSSRCQSVNYWTAQPMETVDPEAAKVAAKPKVNANRPAVKTAEAQQSAFRSVLSMAADVALAVLAAPFSITGCNSYGMLIEGCTATVKDEVLDRQVALQANMHITRGNGEFKAEFQVPAEGEGIGYLPDLVDEQNNPDAYVELQLFSNNRLMGINPNGQHSVAEQEFDLCTAQVTSECTPFYNGIDGYVPVAVPARTEDGWSILQEVGGQTRAVWRPMFTMVEEHGNILEKPVQIFHDSFDNKDKLVVRTLQEDCNSEDLDDPCATMMVYYQVDEHGRKTDHIMGTSDEISGSELTESVFAYYKINNSDAYADVEQVTIGSGTADQVLADPSLKNVDFRMVKDGSVTMQDIYFGNADKGFHGLAVDNEGNVDLSLVEDHQKRMRFNITVVDLVHTYLNEEDRTATIAENVLLADEASVGSYILPKSFYTGGQFQFKIVVELAGTSELVTGPEYIVEASLGLQATLKNVDFCKEDETGGNGGSQ